METLKNTLQVVETGAILAGIGIAGYVGYKIYKWFEDWDAPWDDKPVFDPDFKKPSRTKDFAAVVFPEGYRFTKILDDFLNPSPTGNTKPSASGPPVRLGPIPKRKT